MLRRFRELASLGLYLAAWEARAAGVAHPGPLGLKWGKSPADARSMLAGKIEFVSETPAAEEPYHTLDQHYKGRFGKLQAADILCKFHQGEFFYLAVVLATAEAKSASKVFGQVVSKMAGAYGNPDKLAAPPVLASGKAIQEHLPLSNAEAQALPLLWNEAKGKDKERTFQLQDLNIRTGLWEPFAVWRFTNKVMVQAFIHQAEKGQGPLMPVWIFVSEPRLKAWRAERGKAALIEPRDY